jgi:hypothetical protein
MGSLLREYQHHQGYNTTIKIHRYPRRSGGTSIVSVTFTSLVASPVLGTVDVIDRRTLDTNVQVMDRLPLTALHAHRSQRPTIMRRRRAVNFHSESNLTFGVVILSRQDDAREVAPFANTSRSIVLPKEAAICHAI